jgi:hypothetical protein
MNDAIPKIAIQTNLNTWDVIEKQIERSKIRRYPYKLYLGESLSSYIYRLFSEGLDTNEVLNTIIHNENMLRLIKDHETEKDNILKNLYICVCARASEYSRFNR